MGKVLRLLGLCSVAAALWAAPALALTFDDLVKLRDSGVGDAVLVKMLQTQGVDFEATPETMLKLKEKKFSDDVLVAVVEAAAKKKPGPVPPVTPATPVTPVVPVIPVEPEVPPDAVAPATGRNPFAPRDKKCPQCANRGLLACPQHAATDFVITSAMKEPPACCGGIGWVECPACRDDLTKASVDDLKKALAARREKWKAMDKSVGGELFHGETRHFCLDADMTREEAGKVAAACEDLILKLRPVFGAEAFEFTRPADTRIATMGLVDTWTHFLDWYGADANLKPEQKLRMVQTRGLSMYGTRNYVICVRERAGKDFLHNIVHGYGHVLVNQIYGFKGRLPAWLNEGFSSYVEALELGKPSTWCIDYDPNKDIDPGVQWKESVRRAVAAAKTRQLAGLMAISMTEMRAIDYQQSWSVTTALVAAGADKYLKFVQALKDRTEQTEALEKAYGAKLEDVERGWKDYAARQ
jgi:hypothetical protein